MTADPSKPEVSTLGCFLRIGVGFFALLIVIVVGIFVYVLREHERNKAALAAEIQLIRDRGEPVDGKELNEFYRLPPGMEDITSAYVAALRPCLGNEAQDKMYELRRICTITKRGEEPPHRPIEWKHISEADEACRTYETMLQDLQAAGQLAGGVRYPVDFSGGWDCELPYANAARKVLYPLELSALIHYYRGDFAKCTEVILATIQLGETFRHEPAVLSQLVRHTVLRRARNWTIYFAADPQFPAEELQRVQAAFAGIDYTEARRILFIGERAMTVSTIRAPLTADRAKNCGLTVGMVPAESRPGDCATLLRWQSRSVEVGGLPFTDAVKAADKHTEEVWGENYDSKNRPTWLQNQFSRSQFVEAATCVCWFGREETETRAMVALCAVERFRRDQGKLPQKLSEVTPKFLATVPIDPYKPTQPLSLLHDDEGTYVIYGWGTNDLDDDGDVDNEQHVSDFGVRSFKRIMVAGETSDP